MTTKTNPLLTAPIGKILFQFTIPMVIGLVVLWLSQVIDMYFIGLLGTEALAAASFTIPVTFSLMSLAFGLAVGTSAVVAPTLGKSDYAQARRLTSDSLLLAAIIIVCIAIVGYLTIYPLFRFMGASTEILPLIEAYMQWWYLAVIFMVIPMVGNNAIRATGDANSPTIIMVIAGLLNAVLDPLLIFGIGPFPRLEIEGAAIATLIAWVFTFIASLWILHRWKNLLDFYINSLATLWISWRKILKVAIPAAMVNMLQPISLAIVMMMVVEYGAATVAGFGVGARTEALLLLAIYALSATLPPFIGQNYGAGQIARVCSAVKLAVYFSLLFQLGIYVILLFIAPSLARLFSDDPAVISTIQWFWWIIPISYGALGILNVVSATFNTLHKPMYSLILNLIRLFMLYIPFAYLGGQWFGFMGLVIGCALANILAGIIAYAWLNYLHIHCIAEKDKLMDMP